MSGTSPGNPRFQRFVRDRIADADVAGKLGAHLRAMVTEWGWIIGYLSMLIGFALDGFPDPTAPETLDSLLGPAQIIGYIMVASSNWTRRRKGPG